MGYGRWSNESYTTYAKTTNYVSASRQEVFKQRSIVEALDPSRITLRESCDSVDNPASTPIILALDVTGSMGVYAEMIAKEELPKLMNRILETKPVTDPHLMFMGIDDVHAHSAAPLQVSQFEPDIRILEQLRDIYLVSGGGGNRSESYDLAWYFAAFKTRTDSFEKRGKKGFLFTFGDEESPYQTMSTAQLKSVFGADEISDVYSPQELLALAQKNYHVFHIVIEQGDYCRRRPNDVRATWNAMLGKYVIFLKDFRLLTDVITIAMRSVQEDMPIEQLIPENCDRDAIKYAFQNCIL